MSSHLYVAYVLACLVVVLIPGPSVTLIVATGLKHGTRPALLNAFGGQIGIGLMLLTVLVGLASVVDAMAWLFDWVKIAGAAYLIWMGWNLLRAPVEAAQDLDARRPRGGFVLQGLLVMLANPKGLLFFGAFLPQFINPHGDYQHQALILGLTAMAMGAATDSLYAVLAGRAQNLLSRRRQLINRTGGACLIGGGIWLAFTRAR
jgi:homoserine/homoserine lactone efflux protein